MTLENRHNAQNNNCASLKVLKVVTQLPFRRLIDDEQDDGIEYLD